MELEDWGTTMAVLQRACRNCTWIADFWLLRLLVAEKKSEGKFQDVGTCVMA
jgi:hypothetical protein